jgi:hypothetical protein
MSSKVVAEVEEEPWADDVRLSGGEAPIGMLSSPSAPRAPTPAPAPAPAEMDLLAPLPLRRLGVEAEYLKEDWPLTILARLDFGVVPGGRTGLVVCDCVPRKEEVRTPGVGGADLSVSPTESGEGGRLAMREQADFGGCGKAAALMVRRTVLPAALAPGGRGNAPVGAAAVSSEGRLEVLRGSGIRDLGVLAPEAMATSEMVEELALVE